MDRKWLELLRLASLTSYGLAIAVSDVAGAKRNLYAARRQVPALEGLQLRTSPDDPTGEIWLVKVRAPNGS